MGFLITLTVLSSLPAQPALALPGDSAIKKFLAADAAEVSKNVLAGATSLEEWQQKRPDLHRKYLYALGLRPLPEKTPLKAKVTGTLTRGDVVIEKLHYQSRPGLYVTANLYRPRGAKKKRPAILYLCGHTNKGRDGNKTAFQDHGTWFARNGYVCLIVDTLQLGEIAGVHHGTYDRGRWWWHSRGYTPAGVECWNGIRGIDYLISRPEVDADKIGVTGISGGGATTVWVAAADARVKVAVPVSGMSDLETYVRREVINGHCDCMFFYNTYRWEWTTVAALIAPRPMLFANSDGDPLFPMDGNRRVMARLRQAYKLHGQPGLVDDYVSKGGHGYRPDLRLAVFHWFDRHLMGVKRDVKDADDKPLAGKQLRVFPDDADLPKDAINARIDETFVPLAAATLPPEKGFEAWKDRHLSELRSHLQHSFAIDFPSPELAAEVPGGALYVTEAPARAFLSDAIRKGKRGTLQGTLVILDDADKGDGLPAWARPHVGDGEIRLLRPRGTGPTRWSRRSPPNYVERAHALLGRTVDSGRLRDVGSFAAHQDIGPRFRELRFDRVRPKWTVVGRGPSGVLGAYAALVTDRIGRVVIVDPPRSHRDGPYLLGVQRILDVPVGLGLLAPRPLVLVGAKDKAFDTTAEIYRRAGAAGQLTRK